MKTTADTLTDEALAVLVAVRQAEAAAMTPFTIRRIERIEASQPGRSTWARAVRQTVEDETDELVQRYRDAIIAKADTTVRRTDAGALKGQPLHFVDFDQIGSRSTTVGGFTMAEGVFQTLRQLLPDDAVPGPVIALNIRAELRDATANLPVTATEQQIVDTATYWVEGTGIHEYAHVVSEAAAGRRIDCPLLLSAPERLEAVALALENRPSIAAQAPRHPPEWVRAFYHATRRVNRPELFINDVGLYYRDPASLDAALNREGYDVSFYEPILDILRRPEPVVFADRARRAHITENPE